MRRALVVGIDDYPDAPLAGCVNDAVAVAGLLGRNADGSPNFDVRLLRSGQDDVSRAALRQEIEELFRDPADVALLYFSGHGTENDLGGYLVTPDATRYDEGVALTDVLGWANQSAAREVVVALDACKSGNLGHVPATGANTAMVREGVSILTASRSSQNAMERDDGGVFTELLCGALDGGAADVLGAVTVASVYAYVEQALGSWDQRPLFKAHVATLVSLRRCAPAVPLEELRQLTARFDRPDAVYPLDPSYEDTTEHADPEHVAVFKCLQRCRDAKLVEAVGEEYMYYAAMNSTGCRLTPLGRHFWRLANAGRI